MALADPSPARRRLPGARACEGGRRGRFGLGTFAAAAAGAGTVGNTRTVPDHGTLLHAAIFGSTLQHLASLIVDGFFKALAQWILDGDKIFLSGLWTMLGATTTPLISGSWFDSDFAVMAAIAVAVAVPLLAAAAIQAVARQDASGLLRTAFVRLPFALLFTAVVVQLVQLGLAATDAASKAVLTAGGDPSRLLVASLMTALSGLSGFPLALVAAITAIVSLLVWFELTVRSAAVAVATLFLPLALAGLAWPATSHWARRLGETLAALVLMKLVIAAVLALAIGGLSDPASGISGVMEGIALLGLAGLSPFAMMRLIPMIEAGAVGHLDGLAQRPFRAASRTAMTLGRGPLGGLGGPSVLLFGAGGAVNGLAEDDAQSGREPRTPLVPTSVTWHDHGGGGDPPGGEDGGDPGGAGSGPPRRGDGGPGGAGSPAGGSILPSMPGDPPPPESLIHKYEDELRRPPARLSTTGADRPSPTSPGSGGGVLDPSGTG